MAHQVVLPDPEAQPTMTVEEVAAAFNIARASAYAGVKSGDIPSIRVNRRILCPTAAIRRMLALDESPQPAA